MIESDVQKPDLGEYIVLFDLDATALGGEIYRFTQSSFEASVVTWRGNEYTPFDVLAEGFEISGEGKLPRPTFTIANSTLAVSSAVRAWDDLVGAIVTRWRTLIKYLDGQSSADPDSHFPVDVFVIERKLEHTKRHIQWEMSAVMDQQGKKLPRRQVLRDTCTAIYRTWDGSAFSYTLATCPYTGENYYDRDGVATTAALDRCGKRRTDCELRFPSAALPTTAFPGVARTRV